MKTFNEWLESREHELTPIEDLGISARADYGDLSQWDGLKENEMKSNWLRECERLVKEGDLDPQNVNWNLLGTFYTQGKTPQEALEGL